MYSTINKFLAWVGRLYWVPERKPNMAKLTKWVWAHSRLVLMLLRTRSYSEVLSIVRRLSGI